MKRPFSLSPRLRTVAELVPEGTRLVDVGTDHGRVPVWLLLHGEIKGAVATDLRSGPLERAKRLARLWGVEEQISFRLCDGLSQVSPQEAETVVIAGMGGETIAGILQAQRWTRQGEHLYILQAMSGMDGLRRYLSQNGFSILRELLVPEGETLYVVALVRPGEMPPLTEGEIWVGRQTQGMEAPLRGQYLLQEYEKLCRAAEGMGRSQRPGDAEKRQRYSMAAQDVAEQIKEWKQWQQS